MLISFLERLDHLLMWRAFQPIAHYVDWRWHMNQFRLAFHVVCFAGTCFCVGVLLPLFDHISWINALNLPIMGYTLLAVRGWARNLLAASASFERDPTRVPITAVGFILVPRAFRAMLAIACGNIGGWTMVGAFVMHAPGLVLQAVYLLCLPVIYYIAGSFPSFRPRREKKVWAMAQPLPSAT